MVGVFVVVVVTGTVLVFVVNDGGGVVDGLTICPTLLIVEVVVRTVVELVNGFIAGGGALLAQNPPEPALPERNFASIDGLKSAGIRMRIGLIGSTISPR